MSTDIRVFAASNGLKARFTPYQPWDQQGDENNNTIFWKASLEGDDHLTVEVKDNPNSRVIGTVTGSGNTKFEALGDLARTIRGKLIVLDARSSKRKEIEVPADLIN